MKRLAIITTHPIQYNAPWFRLLAKRGIIRIKVFYTWSQVEKEDKFDPGFGKNIEWDIPLTEDYDLKFVQNVSMNPGSKSFLGIDNPTLIGDVAAWYPDAVLVFGWKFKSHKKAIRYFNGKIPVLFRGDSTTLDDPKGIKKWLRYLILREVYKKVDFALYTGKENRKYFMNSGLKEESLVFVPHAVDNERFAEPAVLKDFRSELKIKDHETVFLFAGKMEPKKNPGLLVKAFHQCKFIDAHLVMVGNGPLESELKNMGNDSNIHFLDFQNQQWMPSVYQMSDVFVLPSQGPGETWGLAVNEAMAAGKPVVVSDACGCVPDLVEEGITGYVFRSGDLTDLINKLQAAYENRSHLAIMGAEGSEKIKDWSFERIVESIEELMNKIA